MCVLVLHTHKHKQVSYFGTPVWFVYALEQWVTLLYALKSAHWRSQNAGRYLTDRALLLLRHSASSRADTEMPQCA